MKNKKILVLLLAPVALTLAGCNRHSPPEDHPIPPVVTNALDQLPTPTAPPAVAVVPTNVPPPAPDLNNTNPPQITNQ